MRNSGASHYGLYLGASGAILQRPGLPALLSDNGPAMSCQFWSEIHAAGAIRHAVIQDSRDVKAPAVEV
jgi:hypothetical protein